MKVYELVVDKKTLYNDVEWRESLGLYRDLYNAVDSAKFRIRNDAEDVPFAVGYQLGDVRADIYGIGTFEQTWSATTVVRTIGEYEDNDEEVWRYFLRERELI